MPAADTLFPHFSIVYTKPGYFSRKAEEEEEERKEGKRRVGREANFIPPPFFPHSKRLLEIPTKRGEINWRYFFHSTLKKKTRFVGSILHPSYLMREKCLLFPEVS